MKASTFELDEPRELKSEGLYILLLDQGNEYIR
jgi:hypothetical protein